MRCLASAASLLCLLALVPGSDAMSIKMKRHSTNPLFKRGAIKRLNRRAQVVGDFASAGVGNSNDLVYTANVTVGGQVHEVVIDTGSSDLWVSGYAEGSVSTGKAASISYAKGAIRGPITKSPVTFAGYTVADQAYINATQKQDVDNLKGILGLGPLVSSQVHDALPNNEGLPFLDRVFLQNTSSPNFISFTLSREEDPTQAIAAELTIGALIEGLENITTLPKNPVQIVPMGQGGGQHWSLLVDSVIGPDGVEIPLTTNVPGQTKPTAVIDSGFSLPQVPKQVTDAFYGRVPGAYYEPEASLWVIPCDQELNVTFVIGGVKYPLHPLDVSLSMELTDGSVICIGSYQPNTVTFGQDVFDMILGDGFLRSTYTLIDFGDFLNPADPKKGDPYIQLLSVVDATESHSDFVKARLSGIDSTSDPKYALLPIGQGKTSPANTIGSGAASRMTLKETKAKINDAATRVKRILIIVGAVVGGLVVLGLLICLLCCCGVCSSLTGRKRGPTGFALKGQETRQVYQPLHAPAPLSHPQEYGFQGKGTYH